LRAQSVLLMLMALCACDRQSAAEKARDDARDVAMVEKAQRQIPPADPLAPQPITFADVQANKLAGAGCAFTAKSGEGGDPVLYADGRRAVLKIDGQLVQFASDAGSTELPYATREHYVGKSLDLRLRKDGGEGVAAGEEAMRWPGSVTVRDPWKREVYSEPGILECGA
jgi:hypothetical protein